MRLLLAFVILVLSGKAQMTLNQLVKTEWINGFPFHIAATFRSEAPRLLQMLNDPAERKNWGRIELTLAIIGEDKMIPRVIDILQNPGRDTLGCRDVGTYLFSLGYLVNRAGNAQALAYLILGTDPDAWNRRVSWTDTCHPTPQERNAHLAKISLLSLGVSGDKVAEWHLRKLLSDSQANGWRDVIQTALEANRKVAAMGLLKYYSDENKDFSGSIR